MKKNEKRILIIDGCLFLAGILMLIIGFLCGSLSETLDFVSDLGNGAMALGGNLVGIDNVNEFTDKFDPYSNLDFDINEIPTESFSIKDMKKYTADEVEGINILVKFGDVDVKASLDEYFGVEADGKGIRYFLRDNELYFTADEASGKIYLPEEMAVNNINIIVTAGDVDLRTDLIAEDIKIYAGAGNVNTKSIKAKNLDIIMGAGNLSLKDCYGDNMKIASVLGNIEIDGDVNEVLEVSGIGNIEIELDGNKDDYNYDLFAKLGTIKVDDNEWTGSNLVKEISNNAKVNVILKTQAGNIEIK